MAGCDRRCPCMHIAGGPTDIPPVRRPGPRPFRLGVAPQITMNPRVKAELDAVVETLRAIPLPPRVDQFGQRGHRTQAAPVHPAGTHPAWPPAPAPDLDAFEPATRVPSMIPPQRPRRRMPDGLVYAIDLAAGVALGLVIGVFVIR